MDPPFLWKLALIGILGGVFLLWGPLGGVFWWGVALTGLGVVSLLMALRAMVIARREPEADIEADRPVLEPEEDIDADQPVWPATDLEDQPTHDPVAGDRRALGLEITLRGIIALGTVALLWMKIFVWSPEAMERRTREEKMRKDLIQVERDARAGKTGKALQFLVTGDRSLLESMKKDKEAGRAAVKDRDDPRPPSARP